MIKPDEIVEAGFATLRSAEPRRGPADLMRADRRRTSKAKVKKVLVGVTGCLALALVVAATLQPTSAWAALQESARLTANQPIIHLHVVNHNSVVSPTTPPWPSVPPLDIWKFRDHYVRSQGHTIAIAYKTGSGLAYDDRFKTGYRFDYDAAKDQFWSFDGTIGIVSLQHPKDLRKIPDARYRGGRFIEFAWQQTDGMRNSKTNNIYVDPDTQLVRFGDSFDVAANGDTSHGVTTAEYPDASTAEGEAPKIPLGLKLQTKEELTKDFNSRIGQADQAKSLKGIRTTLFGVIVHPNVPDGLGVDIITQGGAGPELGSGLQAEIVGGDLLPTKRLDWFPQFADPKHSRNGLFETIGGRNYIVNFSNDLLTRAPSKITVRIPVWRLGKSTVVRDGKAVKAHDFVGYVTFTTSKIFFLPGDLGWNYYGAGHS